MADPAGPGTVLAEREGDGGADPVLTPRGVTLGGAAFLVLLLVGLAALLPVPYILYRPGLLANTIGQYDGEEILVIEGRETYPTTGNLDLTTVEVVGGPGRRIDLLTALHGWLDPTIAAVPEEQVYPRGTTGEQVRRQNTADMELSQRVAAAAALRALDIPVTEVPAVGAIPEGAPAEGVLEPGDVIVAVDGEPVDDAEEVRAAITTREPGDPVEVTVRRDGEEVTGTVTTIASEQDPAMPVVGIVLATTYEFPFEVEFQVEGIGGPSAGMMFALGIIDKLTPGALNDGAYVAGTGTIDPEGNVGPIGSIQQKLVAAERAGADLFLAPAANCPDVVAATPEGLEVARVETLDDALDALEALREGDLSQVERCAA